MTTQETTDKINSLNNLIPILLNPDIDEATWKLASKVLIMSNIYTLEWIQVLCEIFNKDLFGETVKNPGYFTQGGSTDIRWKAQSSYHQKLIIINNNKFKLVCKNYWYYPNQGYHPDGKNYDKFLAFMHKLKTKIQRLYKQNRKQIKYNI